ncbi:hypothetical protein SEA_XKCD426_44 [Streptomyces phage Xkcd426]|nr:hypothetical protein SEA_XKCD426_44 [Streptomyces phage Xkcd426]
MKDRKLNTRPDAPGDVGRQRREFDNHLSTCVQCQPALCHVAEALWRSVCISALVAHRTAGGEV